MPTSLLAVAIGFMAVSFGGYFAIHELKEKDVKRIEKQRIQVVRNHLKTLTKKCSKTKNITDDLENEFLDLFQKEYDHVHDPSRMLFSIDRYFLFSGIFFLAATLMDWANDNFSFISSQSSPLAPFEYVLFIYGLFFLAIGIFYVERLRRITSKEGDLDPPPFEGTVFIGIFLTIDILLIFVTIPNYSLLTPFGRALLGSAIISLIGAPIAFLTWERQGWRRLLGLILLVAPFILIFAWLLLTALKIL